MASLWEAVSRGREEKCINQNLLAPNVQACCDARKFHPDKGKLWKATAHLFPWFKGAERLISAGMPIGQWAGINRDSFRRPYDGSLTATDLRSSFVRSHVWVFHRVSQGAVETARKWYQSESGSCADQSRSFFRGNGQPPLLVKEKPGNVQMVCFMRKEAAVVLKSRPEIAAAGPK